MKPPNEIDPRFASSSPSAAHRKRGPWKLLTLLAAVVLVVGGIVAVNPGSFGLGGASDERGVLTYTVAKSALRVTVTAEGNVESASNVEVKCRVAGGATILWIVEDGKVVEEGEKIVQLDTSAIDDKLNSQKIVYEKAVATEIQAREDLEATTISVKEYEEGTFLEVLKQSEANIQIAMENLRSSENQLNYSKRMVRKGFASSLQREADEFGVERAKLDLDAANMKKKVLTEFTKLKTMKDLQAKREAAAARLRSEQASLQLEKARLERLQEQLKNCVITAPKRGMVVYANDSRSRFSSSSSSSSGPVEEGAMVRESQALVRLPDLARMQVKVTVHESKVEQIKRGMPALVVIQDVEHVGRVLNIANQPSQSSFSSAQVKEYATIVSVDGETTGLKPGMTAKVTILIDDLKDVLTVPVSCVVERQGKFWCWVKTVTSPERRPLKLGKTNDKLIEIVDGVKEGDEVYRNPRAVVAEAREEPAFEKQVEDPKFPAGSAPSGPGSEAKGKENGSNGGANGGAAPTSPSSPGASAAAPGGAPSSSVEAAAAGSGEAKGDGSSKKRGARSFDLMQYDKDGDKKVSREEVPEQMQAMFDGVDTNTDGFIDASEIAAMRQRFGGGRSKKRNEGEGGGGAAPGAESGDGGR